MNKEEGTANGSKKDHIYAASPYPLKTSRAFLELTIATLWFKINIPNNITQ